MTLIAKHHATAYCMNQLTIREKLAIIEKFVRRVDAWGDKYAAHKAGNGPLPRPVAKTAKYPAYEAATFFRSYFVGVPHASSVADLRQVVAIVRDAIAAGGVEYESQAA